MFNTIFLQAQSGGSNPLYQFAPFILIIIVFYFFMIRPQQKKAKEQTVFRQNIKKGDKVVTVGGLHGKIYSIEADDTIMVEVDRDVRLKFEKSAISMESSKKYQTTA